MSTIHHPPSTAPLRAARPLPQATAPAGPAASRHSPQRDAVSRNTRRALFLLAALAALGGYFAWPRADTPAHALRRLSAAMRMRDLAGVEQGMDVRAVSRALADDWVAARARERSEGGPATVGSLDSLDAEVARTARAIENDLRAGLRDDSLAAGGPLRQLIDAARLPRSRLGRVTLEGGGEANRPARVELRYPHLDTAVTLNATLARRNQRWVLTGVQGLDQAGRAILDAEANRLLAINRPVHTALAEMLRLGEPELVVDTLGRPAGWASVSMMVTNQSRRPITGVRLRVFPVRHPSAAVIVELPAGDTLLPNSSARLAGRSEGSAVYPFLAVLRGRDDLDATVTAGIVGVGRSARRYQAVERWDR